MGTFDQDSGFSQRYAEAVELGKKTLETEPRAVGIAYDAASGKFVLNLASGVSLLFGADGVPELAGATPDELAEVEVLGVGLAVSWPRLDADVSVPGLVMALTWGPEWRQTMRRLVYQETGRIKSEAGRLASRENGKKGGRPRKKAATDQTFASAEPPREKST